MRLNRLGLISALVTLGLDQLVKYGLRECFHIAEKGAVYVTPFFDLVMALQKEFNIALVSVTHDEGLAENYPHVYRLIDGKLVKDK